MRGALDAMTRGAGPALASTLGLLLLWQVLAMATAGAWILASPLAVLDWAAERAGLLARATAVTLGAAAQGFLWGNVAALLLALFSVLVPRSERVLSALSLLAFCLPLVATGPILRVLYGPGTGPQVTLAALACCYTTHVALLVGLRAAPPGWLDLIRSYGRGRVTALLQVRAMAALPYLAAGLQIAAPAAILGAMVGEFTGAERGLGVLILRTLRGLDVAGTWAIGGIAAAAAIAAHAAVGALARRVTRAPPPVILAVARPGTGRGPLARLAGAVGLILLVLALWWAVMEAAGLPAFFAKRPGDVWAYLAAGPAAGLHRAQLLAALAQTLAIALPGYLAGLALGVGIAAALVLAPRVAGAAMPLAIALRSIPILATAPLIVLALGRGAAGGIAIVATMIFFPTLVACLQGMRQTPAAVTDIFDSYGASRLTRLIHAQAPAMLPAFFASARMAVPAAILAATTAEWLATGRGLGALMATVASTSDYGMLWSATALIASVAMLAWAGLARVERAVLARAAPEQLS